MSYIGNQPSGEGQAERFIFTATGTTPTITHDDDGLPISYVVNHVSVYLNGVKQVIPTDVAASNGSTLVFAANLAVNDVVECIALSTFSAVTTEGSSILSTGETGGTKFLREDGDNSSSWQTVAAGIAATHDGVAKAWVNMSAGGTNNDSYNVSSTSDASTGLFTVNFDTDMANIHYSVVTGVDHGGSSRTVSYYDQAVGSVVIKCVSVGAEAATDPDSISVVIFGELS